jgi:hypothetical protein
MIEKLCIICCIVTIFSENPTYDPTFFLRRYIINLLSFCFWSLNLFSLADFSIGVYSLRFQMSHSRYLCIAHAVEEHDEYFVKQKIEMDILAYHVYRWLH